MYGALGVFTVCVIGLVAVAYYTRSKWLKLIPSKWLKLIPSRWLPVATDTGRRLEEIFLGGGEIVLVHMTTLNVAMLETQCNASRWWTRI